MTKPVSTYIIYRLKSDHEKVILPALSLLQSLDIFLIYPIFVDQHMTIFYFMSSLKLTDIVPLGSQTWDLHIFICFLSNQSAVWKLLLTEGGQVYAFRENLKQQNRENCPR